MYRTLVILGLVLVTHAGVSQSKNKVTPATQKVVSQSKTKALSDNMLDRVTAGGISATVSQGVVTFAGQVPTANGLVSSNGTLAIQTAPLSGTTTLGTLSIGGNAQQNLSSLININAVNSEINVLLNLNIDINSTIGTILQSNLAGKH
jgi:hypothetical protein